MLAIQIAAGIVLAYAIILNQKRLLALGGWLLRALAIIVAIAGIVWAGTSALQMAGAAISPRFIEEIWTFVGIAPAFILGFTATLGMTMLGGAIVGRNPATISRDVFAMTEDKPGAENENGGCGGLFVLFMATAMVNYFLSFPAWNHTPIGHWYEAVDAYGRAKGWKDGLSVLFAALLCQWVWIPLGIYYLEKRFRHTRESQVGETPERTLDSPPEAQND